MLGHAVAAPSTLGTFLRAFTFGHVRQLDRVLAECLSRAWAAGAGPGEERLVVDVDSFVGEVYGYDKQGAGYGYTHKRGYHPIVATRAATGEVLHIRARKGSANTSRGALRFVEELIPRVAARRRDRAEAVARGLGVLEPARSWPGCRARGLDLFDRGAPAEAHQGRDRRDPRAGLADPRGLPRGRRGADRADDARPPTTDRASHPPGRRPSRAVARLASFAFLTNRTDPLELVEAEHRQHAVVELAIRDLKDQALAHFPSGKFLANAAWTVIAALAHNLLRWTTLIGLPDTTIPTARTLRRRLLTVPGRITRTARTVTLRMPARWPWEHEFLTALQRLRAIPALT